MSEIYRNSEFSQEDILEQAVERLAAGESLDAILASFGPDGDWLAPLLNLAADVRELGEAVLVPRAEANLATFLAQAQRLAPASSLGPSSPRWWERLAEGLRLPASGFARLAATTAGVTLAIIGLTLGSAFFLGSSSAAAQGILPGQALYPLKRLGEEMMLRLPQSDASRDARSVEYEGRRRDEIHRLLDHHREARVVFPGTVDDLSPTQIIVSGIRLGITHQTQIEGPLAIGARVWVEARAVRDGAPIAQRIVVEELAQPMPTASPTHTQTATPSATPTPTPEPTVTPIPPPTTTPDRSESDTIQPAPGPKPTEETPEEPEDEKEEEEIEDNENEGKGTENEPGDEGNENEGEDEDSEDVDAIDEDNEANENEDLDESNGGNENDDQDGGDNSDDDDDDDDDSDNDD